MTDSSKIDRWLAVYLLRHGLKVQTVADTCGLSTDEVALLMEDDRQEFNRIEREYMEHEKPRVQKEVEAMLAEIPEEEKRSIRINLIFERLQRAKREKDQNEYRRLRTQYQVLKGIEEGIDPQDVLHARDYPITNLVKSVRGMALCPFHNERTPSMDIRKNFYHCYGCGQTGDVIDFVRKLEGLTFKQAITRLT